MKSFAAIVVLFAATVAAAPVGMPTTPEIPTVPSPTIPLIPAISATPLPLPQHADEILRHTPTIEAECDLPKAVLESKCFIPVTECTVIQEA
ncbi:hypothetical protein BGZ93_010050, partial [Podila epicladia]